MDINTCLATTAEYRNLALFSHLIPAASAIVLGVFAIRRAQNRHKAEVFLAFTVAFATWLVADLIVWTADSYSIVAAFWAPLDFVEIVFFLLLFYFVWVDLYSRYSARFVQSLILVAAITPFVITLSGQAVLEFYQPFCEMVGNDFLAQYKIIAEGLILAAILALGAYRFMYADNAPFERSRIAVVITAIVLFMGVFGGSEYVATTTNIFEINLYTLFSLPIFILMLTIAITSYGTFKLGDNSVKALFYVFLLLAATQFFFVNDMQDFLLGGMSFVAVLTLGIMLYRTSERETRQRHVIEVQARYLETLNHQQEGLLAFISHEVKGYLAKGQGAFAGILEGDYGPVSPQLRTMADAAVIDARKGVDMVGDILDASNLRKGTVSYTRTTFDFKQSVEQVIHDLHSVAEKKGIALDFSCASGEYRMAGDEAKIRRHVIRNLVENSIHYTLKGSIHVSLSRNQSTLHFSVKDTGVGITKEDMQHLFTEGGHGKESIKVNVDSTGYGLFIAKQVTEAHSGKIWAQSKGKGEGSEFIVELPVT